MTVSHLTSIVGKVRINSSVSGAVQSAFSKFALGFDLVEIFDNSIPNDPSPPCKAAAVIHRSRLHVGPSQTVACATVVRQKIFDYNNRDFQRFQLQRLVDGIASNWLAEEGGGIQLTVDRAVPPISQRLWGKGDPAKTISAIAKSKEFNSHRNFRIFNQKSFWFNPLTRRGGGDDLVQVDASPDGLIVIDGLGTGVKTYTYGDRSMRLVSVDRVRMQLTCQVLTIPDDQSIASFSDMMTEILKREKCIEGILMFDSASHTVSPGIHNAFVINYKTVNFRPDHSLLSQPMLIHPEFMW